MVVALGPGRFYGSGLPRPRFYPDPKLNSYRVDPPESVMDPFLCWANEAHWSMGGLSTRRLRLQGKIEGSISKLRKSMSPKRRKTDTGFTKKRLASLDEEDDDETETDEEVYDSDVEERDEVEVEEVDEEDGEEEEGEEEEGESEEDMEVSTKKRKRARRLGEEFDRIAEEAKKGKGDKNKKVSKRGKGKEKEVEKPRRVSPRKKMK